MAENIIVLSAMLQEGDMTNFNRIKAGEQQLVTFKVKKPAAAVCGTQAAPQLKFAILSTM